MIEDISELLINVQDETLKFFRIERLEENSSGNNLALISNNVAPFYFPFWSFDDCIFAFHILPGIKLKESPIFLIDTGSQEARFFTDRISNFAISYFMMFSIFFKKKKEAFFSNIQKFNDELLGEKKIDLVDLYFGESNLFWRFNRSHKVDKIWKLLELNEELLRFPVVDSELKPAEALDLLMESSGNATYINAIKVCTLAKMRLYEIDSNVNCRVKDVVDFLYASAFFNIETPISGAWRVNGRGLSDWDAVLKSTKILELSLKGTPFELLDGHVDTYNTDDKDGYKRLIEISKIYRSMNDYHGVLNQLKNAATLQIFSHSTYSPDVAMAIAEASYKIEPNCLAGRLAELCAKNCTMDP